MNLRTKLLIGYLVFVAALIVLGGWSTWHLLEMGGVSRNILANNYDSVVAAQGMRESLDRQGSAVLFALLGHPEPTLTKLAEERKRLDAHFQRASNNITEPTEGEIIESIRRDRSAADRKACRASIRAHRQAHPERFSTVAGAGS